MAERYNFKYLPLVGKLPGKSMVEQTESAINELASVVYDNVGYVGNLAEEVQTANTNASNALEKATEALETSGRVYIKLIAAVDVNDYYDSELYYINNDGSTNIPVRDRGFLEVKTNDDKTDCEQVFIADSTGTPYYRHGVITEQTLGEETTYVVTWGSWYQGATTEYVQGVKAEVNAYTDEQIRQHGNVPVGFEYFSMNPNVPQGSLPLLGGEYSRATYSDLWEWVQTQTGYLKTEADWQDLATANNGNVPYYSDGDGSTTFRVPSLKCWIKGANGTVTEVGSYLEAGLPNITGGFDTRTTNYHNGAMHYNYSGALYQGTTSGASDAVTQYNGSQPRTKTEFDASRSSAIYGNSNTVQPESIVGMWLVKAYGTVVDTGQIDEQQYIDDRIAAEVTRADGKYLPLAGGTMTGNLNFEADLSINASADNQSIGINGGTAWNKGGWLSVWGKDHATYPGWFSLHANNGTNEGAFVGRPDGTLIWNNKPVMIKGVANGHGIQTGEVTGITVNASSYKQGSVTFNTPFSGTPVVTATYSRGYTNMYVSVYNVSSTGFSYTLTNENNSQETGQTFTWIAIY